MKNPLRDADELFGESVEAYEDLGITLGEMDFKSLKKQGFSLSEIIDKMGIEKGNQFVYLDDGPPNYHLGMGFFYSIENDKLKYTTLFGKYITSIHFDSIYDLKKFYPRNGGAEKELEAVYD